MWKLFYKISLVIFFAFLLSIGVDYLYRQTYLLQYKFPQNIFIYPEIADKYKLVKLGNSHSDDGLTFEKYKLKSLDLASIAQTYEYDLAMLKMHEKQIDSNAVIIINVSPISFSQIKPDVKANVNTQYYDGRLSPFIIPHMDISKYLQIQIVPFVRSGYLWRTEYAKELKEKAMSGYAASIVKPTVPPAPPPAVTEIVAPTPAFYIRSVVPTFNVAEINAEINAPPEPSSERLMESMRFMVNKWNNSGGFDPIYFETNRQDLQTIIDYCLEHKWRPILVTLPLNQVLLDGLGRDYMKRYIYENLAYIDTHGSPYINFMTSQNLTHNRYIYSNTDHLNAKGAAIASYLLLQKLIDMKYLPKEADGYDYTPKEILPYETSEL